MKKSLCVLTLLLGVFSFTGCCENIEITIDGFEVTPDQNSKFHFGLKPDSEFYWGLKPETLEDLQEYRGNFAEENKDDHFRRDIGLAMMDKMIELVEEKGWYVEE